MKEALRAHRQMLRENGLKRVEVLVPHPDAELVRRVAKALTTKDPTSDVLRATIEKAVPVRNRLSFKEWLATPEEDDANA
ncbi:hypothetical protein [Geminicoccus roseus]|uniref:hypothetical protein n=1 Tax=Geminicoccus roseus TaxID=404900 RepID=UPI0004243228|nr:hypothetical protein [Geminicoccus roseus]